MPSTTRSSSTSTRTRPGVRSATIATECASTGSVLRPSPVANTRTCTDSFAGTSRTVSPSCTSRCAMCLPIPLQPSTTHPIGEPSPLGQHLLKVLDRVGGVHHLAIQSSGVTGAMLVAMASSGQPGPRARGTPARDRAAVFRPMHREPIRESSSSEARPVNWSR